MFILVLPFGLLALGGQRLMGTNLCFVFFGQSFSLMPGLPGTIIRACYYKQTLKESSLDLDVGFGGYISKMQTRIGKNVLLGCWAQVGLANIADNAVLANKVSVLSGRHQHNFSDPNANILGGEDGFVSINLGEGCFIGESSVIMADIGAYTVVGAGSVVPKPLPDYVVAVGNPAKVVKKRPRLETTN